MTRRGNTGSYEVTTLGGEQDQAFIPKPLPPDPPVALANSRQRLLERATLALGRVDSITLLLPDPNIFLYADVRREAVLSSQTEGTQSSLADLLLFENDFCQRTGLSFPTATKRIDKLMNLGIVKERTGGRRNRVFSYERYLAILNEGTEPL